MCIRPVTGSRTPAGAGINLSAIPLLVLLIISLALAGCHKKRASIAVPRPVGAKEVGIASWYGHPYHGRQAASGEIYDMEKFTAAHRTLPFGTWVRVRNLKNEKTVDVRINDRGPFVGGRIIDLSHAAAWAIGLIRPGTEKVRLEVIAAPAVIPPAHYAVQVGAFQDRANAERIRKDMERRYGSARLVLRQGSPPVWRVLVGSEPGLESASALADRVRSDGEAGAGSAFVVRIDPNEVANRI